MEEIKIIEAITPITSAGPGGIQISQPRRHLELRNAETNELLPDNIYTLHQNNQTWLCNVTYGEAKGVDSIDRSKPIFCA